MACLSCGGAKMIFEGHHGMEHNVCELCGTIIECDQLVSDICHTGFKKVFPDYEVRSTGYGSRSFKILRHKSRINKDAVESIDHLMDVLNLPPTVRKAASDFLAYTSHLNKTASVGACVYLAMKDFNMPITIRYIANYLQVSHYAIGRVMRNLEKRLVNRRKGTNVFGVDQLIPLIYSQAKFGSGEAGKKMYNLFLDKTKKLINLLQECQATTGYEPHLIILAAGYVVWKSLYFRKWDELDLVEQQPPNRTHQNLHISLFLSEVGIQISNLGSITSKVSLITDLLQKLADQIPWLSVKNLSKDDVILYLNDLFKYKSQIIEMTAREMADGKKITSEKVDLEVKEEVIDTERAVDPFKAPEEPSTSCFLDSSSAPMIDNVSEHDDQNNGDVPSSLKEDLEESTIDSKSKEESSHSKLHKTSHGKMRFVRVKDILNLSLFKERQVLNKSLPVKVSSMSDTNTCTSDVIDAKKGDIKQEAMSNGYNQLLKLTHPQLSQTCRKRKAEPLFRASDRENPFLYFP